MKIFRLVLIASLIFSINANAQLELLWQNDSSFKNPESVAYDKVNKCLYVSNFKRVPKNGEIYNEDYISKVDLNGKVLVKKYVTNLTQQVYAFPTTNGTSRVNQPSFLVKVVNFDPFTETEAKDNGPNSVLSIICPVI
jgi:hypothetical protein